MGLHRGVGGGQAATNAIIAKHTGVALNTYAAGVADSYTAPSFNGVSKDDYYLPTRDELDLMLKNLTNVGVGGFVADNYWSSSETGASIAWDQSLLNGYQNYNFKSSPLNNVRPVRAF
jgi:hypothetical protein